MTPEEKKQKDRAYYLNNKARILARQSKYRLENLESISKKKKVYMETYNTVYRERNKERTKAYTKSRAVIQKAYNRKWSLNRKYGITLEQYNNMFSTQKGCCAICGIHQSSLNKPLFVDHDHNTGKVRGLLCHSCNVVLGHVNDSIDILDQTIKYLLHG